MRIIIAACLFVIFTCAGCGMESYWYNEQNTYQRARADCMECLYQAQKAVSDLATQDENNTASPTADKPESKILFKECMQENGYKKTWDYKLDYNIRKGFVEHNKILYNIAGK